VEFSVVSFLGVQYKVEYFENGLLLFEHYWNPGFLLFICINCFRVNFGSIRQVVSCFRRRFWWVRCPGFCRRALFICARWGSCFRCRGVIVLTWRKCFVL